MCGNRPGDHFRSGLGVVVDEFLLLKDLSDKERLMFQSEMSPKRKDATVGVLLALFLGGLGGHRFYMGQTGLGVVYILLCWTFVPTVVGLVEAFFMSKRVREHNAQAATEVVMKIKAFR